MVLWIYLLVNTIIIIYFLRKNLRTNDQFNLKFQSLEEKINILTEQNRQDIKTKQSLQDRIIRYNRLKQIIEQINQDLDIDYIGDKLTDIVFSVIGNSQGTCILYLIDNQTQKPFIFKVRKENRKLIIKAKEGDIFDFWVLRHTTPLFIEDISRDFRFDFDKLKTDEFRPVLSLLCVPLLIENRIIGILRLDNPKVGYYSQDDLRLLAVIGDIAAVAIENGQLYQKTQDLAIHDSLTGLYTKGYFVERLRQECARSARRQLALSVLMLDIDFFKKYNDEFGHTAGDIVLKNLSSRVSDFLTGQTPSVISRFGGEEFCIALLGKDKKEAVVIAEELRSLLEDEKVVLAGQPTSITVSIGVSGLGAEITNEEDLVRAADRAMYEAKQQGRNRVIAG